MTSISNILSQLPNFQHLSPNTPFALKTQQLQAHAQTTSTSSFSFTTAEGDRVSLSTGSESKLSFESYNFQGLAKGQVVGIRNQQLSTSVRSDFSLLIEGDLNEQEQADIQAFLQLTQGILQGIATGNVENSTEAAFSLGDLDSLSSAALFFRQETTVSRKAQATQLAIQDHELSNEPRRRGFPTGQGHKIENIFDRIQKAQEQFRIDPEKAAKKLPRLLNKLIDTLQKPFSQEDFPGSIFDDIRKDLLKSLIQAKKGLIPKEDTPEKLEGKDQSPEERDQKIATRSRFSVSQE